MSPQTSVNVTSNSPSQDYTHPDDHNLPNYDMTSGLKPFTALDVLNFADNAIFSDYKQSALGINGNICSHNSFGLPRKSAGNYQQVVVCRRVLPVAHGSVTTELHQYLS